MSQNDPNARKSLPYGSFRAVGCCRPQLFADGKQLKKVSNDTTITDLIFSCPPSTTSCGRQQLIVPDELYDADLRPFWPFLRS
jgi:hypothetical protein